MLALSLRQLGWEIACGKSVDLERWEKPKIFYEGKVRYPTLVRDSGDVETTNREAILYFGRGFVVRTVVRGLWGVKVSF